MDTIISTASTTFAATTGFNYGSVIEYMGDLVRLVIGTGLGVLQVMLPWILALVVISAIVYFLYRAFKFFRH